jgi:hypothetical protein
MWVRFHSVHWHRFNRSFARRFMPGSEHNLPRAVADKAVADGHATRLKKPAKNTGPEPADGDQA